MCVLVYFFFFKQKTAYEMRISDWSSDVCSSDLYELYGRQELADGRLRLTANVFYADYKDYQLTFDRTPTDLADYDFVVDNADKVKTYGAEAGATWLVMRGLEVYLNQIGRAHV